MRGLWRMLFARAEHQNERGIGLAEFPTTGRGPCMSESDFYLAYATHDLGVPEDIEQVRLGRTTVPKYW